MRVGITGTHKGATKAQLQTLRRLLTEHGATRLHHGDCVGADAQAHGVGRELGLFVVVHPPIKDKLRAFCVGDEIRRVKPYLVRDCEIVDECELLLALPDSYVERARSGTWYTVRYARREHRRLIIIGPDGGTVA